MTGLALQVSEKQVAFPLGYSGSTVSSHGKKSKYIKDLNVEGTMLKL